MRGSRFNGFDVLRICAALVVVASHAAYLAAGVAEPVLLRWGSVEMNPGFIAVAVFFVTSGYLVAASWTSDPRPARFAARRFARIWPGLLLVLVVTTFVVGPLVTTLQVSEYLSSPLTWFYWLSGSVLDIHYELPGVFAGNPDVTVDGSLWSLPLEVACYAALVVGGLVGVLRSRRMIIAVTVLVVVWAWFVAVDAVPAPPNLGGAAFHFLPALAALFALGVTARTVNVSRSWWLALAALVALVAVRDSLLEPVGLVAIAYLTVWAGTSATRAGAWLHQFGDPSYGIYVWGWVITQLLVALGLRMQLPLMAASLAVTTVAGYVSWWAVERRALERTRTRLARHDSDLTLVAQGGRLASDDVGG